MSRASGDARAKTAGARRVRSGTWARVRACERVGGRRGGRGVECARGGVGREGRGGRARSDEPAFVSFQGYYCRRGLGYGNARTVVSGFATRPPRPGSREIPPARSDFLLRCRRAAHRIPRFSRRPRKPRTRLQICGARAGRRADADARGGTRAARLPRTRPRCRARCATRGRARGRRSTRARRASRAARAAAVVPAPRRRRTFGGAPSRGPAERRDDVRPRERGATLGRVAALASRRASPRAVALEATTGVSVAVRRVRSTTRPPKIDDDDRDGGDSANDDASASSTRVPGGPASPPTPSPADPPPAAPERPLSPRRLFLATLASVAAAETAGQAAERALLSEPARLRMEQKRQIVRGAIQSAGLEPSDPPRAVARGARSEATRAGAIAALAAVGAIGSRVIARAKSVDARRRRARRRRRREKPTTRPQNPTASSSPWRGRWTAATRTTRASPGRRARLTGARKGVTAAPNPPNPPPPRRRTLLVSRARIIKTSP